MKIPCQRPEKTARNSMTLHGVREQPLRLDHTP